MEISEKTVKFIKEHALHDVNALRLKFAGKSDKMDIPIEFSLLQIEARRKAQKKLPSFLENDYFVFPDTLSSEQASNEAVARFHASLLDSGSSLLDLTAGLGIDDMTFAMNGINVTACEINGMKSEALRHNSEVFGLTDHIKVLNIDSMAYVDTCESHYDIVFADPARRSSAGKRVHALSDCLPDIFAGMESIMRLSDRVLIKSSPLLDLTLIRKTVENLSHIFVVSFKGECKEVLIDIRKDAGFSGVTVVDLDMNGILSTFDCHHSPVVGIPLNFAERKSPTDYRYLYEPNAGIMKTGAWEQLCQRFNGLYKADSNTHIFLSDTLFTDFPGRILAIDELMGKKALKELKGRKYNVVTRNYPLTAQELTKKISMIPGGDRFLYAFRYKDKPVILTANLFNS
ncbi:MAG: hypothetical protein K2N25_04245 [Muribaculaceae bacterium]|nr:hypothetical protein [Muribaculaceae bacterium]